MSYYQERRIVMAKKPRTGKNIIYSSIYEILVVVVPLIVSPHISRALGVEGIGIFSFSIAVANYFKRASMLGAAKYGSRSIALVNNRPIERRNIFWTVYSVQFCATAVCILMYSGYILLFARNNVPAILQYIYIFTSLFGVEWYFQGREEFGITILITTICKIAYLIGSLTLIRDRKDVHLYIVLFSLSHLVPSMICFGIAIRREKFLKPKADRLKSALKGMVILFIPVIAVTVYKSMDKLMIGILSDTSYANGIYENAEKILHVPIAFISAVSAVLMPRMTVLFRDSDEKKANQLIFRTIKYSALMSMGCAFGLAALSTMFSVIYWGQEFRGCGELLTIFAISIPVMSFAEILRTQYIIPRKKDKIYIVAVSSAAVINLIINLALIPRIGAKGAVIGTITSEGAVCIYQAFKVRNELPIFKYVLQYSKFIIPGAVMYTAICYLINFMSYSVIHLIELVMIGGMIYIMVFSVYMLIFERKAIFANAQRVWKAIKLR